VKSLGWDIQYGIDEMMGTAWAWEKKLAGAAS